MRRRPVSMSSDVYIGRHTNCEVVIGIIAYDNVYRSRVSSVEKTVMGAIQREGLACTHKIRSLCGCEYSRKTFNNEH